MDVTPPTDPDNDLPREPFDDTEAERELIRRLVSSADSSALRNFDDPLPQCPSEFEVVRVAAGYLSPAVAEPILRHAARCATCGPILKRAAESMSSPLTQLEQRLVDQLASQPNFPLPSRFVAPPADRAARYRPRIAAAAVLLASLSAVGWLAYDRFQPNQSRTARLLAQSYSAHRPFEPRIPSAQFAEVSVQRGPASSSDLTLNEANLASQRSLLADPANPDWLLLRGRAELLYTHYDSAIEIIHQSLEKRSSDPAALAELGCAYIARGDAENRPADFAKALEVLGRSLQARPRSPEVIYNLALASERLRLIRNAMDYWTSYLQIDPTGPWADDARRHLAQLDEKKN